MAKMEDKAYKLLKNGLAQTSSMVNGNNCYYEKNDGISFMNTFLFNVSDEWIVADETKKQLYRGDNLCDAIICFINRIGSLDSKLTSNISPLSKTMDSVKLIKKENIYKRTTEYVDWLENYTKKTPTFNCDSWMYIYYKDQEKVQDIKCLYYIVKDYALENGIAPVALERDYVEAPDKYYLMSYNGVIYRIGSDSNDICPWVSRLLSTSENMNNVISFDDIMNEKKKNYKNPIEDKLDDFDSYLEQLAERVPKRLIKIRFEKFMEDNK